MKFWPLGCREAFFKDFLLRLDKIYVKYVRRDLSPPSLLEKILCDNPKTFYGIWRNSKKWSFLIQTAGFNWILLQFNLGLKVFFYHSTNLCHFLS